MEILENFIKTLDVTNFIIVIIITVLLTLLFSHYFNNNSYFNSNITNENFDYISTPTSTSTSVPTSVPAPSDFNMYKYNKINEPIVVSKSIAFVKPMIGHIESVAPVKPNQKAVSSPLNTPSPLPDTKAVESQKASKALKASKLSKLSKLSYYYMNGCTFCKQFKPEWEQLKRTVASTPLNNIIELYENDCNENPAGCSSDDRKYINGFPTVLLEKIDGSKVVYTDFPRTHNSVLKFLEENL